MTYEYIEERMKECYYKAIDFLKNDDYFSAGMEFQRLLDFDGFANVERIEGRLKDYEYEGILKIRQIYMVSVVKFRDLITKIKEEKEDLSC